MASTSTVPASSSGPGVQTASLDIELPTDWRVAELGELFEIQQGKALSKKARSGKSPRHFLRTANVLWGRLDLTTLDKMDFSQDEAKRLDLEPGDLLVCEGGDVGRTALWRGEMEDISYQNHLHRLRRRNGDVVPEFYMYWMQAALLHLGLYAGTANRTTIPNLSKARLGRYPVPVPPAVEQHAIAMVLRTVQQAKEATEKVIVTSGELERSLMRHLFTHGPSTLAEAEDVELQETEIGLMPGHWAAVPLGEVATISTGTTPSTAKAAYWSGTIPFIKTSEIINNEITSAKSNVTDNAIRDYRLKLYQPGTVFLAMYGQGKTRGQVALLRIAATTSQNTGAIVAGASLDSEFLWLYLLSRYEHLRASGIQGHISHLNAGYLKQVIVPVPPRHEQQAIARILLAARAKRSAEEASARTLSSVLDSIMSELLTGRRRVAITEGVDG